MACALPRGQLGQVPPESVATVYAEVLEDVRMPRVSARTEISEGQAKVRIERVITGRAKLGVTMPMRFAYFCGPGGPPVKRGLKVILYLTDDRRALWWPTVDHAARFDPRVAKAFGRPMR